MDSTFYLPIQEFPLLYTITIFVIQKQKGALIKRVRYIDSNMTAAMEIGGTEIHCNLTCIL